MKKLIGMSLCLAISASVISGCTIKDKIQEITDPGNVVSEKEKEKFQVFPLGDGSRRILITDLFEEKTIDEESTTYFYNEKYETHFLIKEEKKENLKGIFLEDYIALSKESISQKLEEVEKEWIEEGLEENQREYYMKGRLDGSSITYGVEIMETEGAFYEMILWSFTENVEENKEYYQDLLRSFETVDVAGDPSDGELDEPEL